MDLRELVVDYHSHANAVLTWLIGASNRIILRDSRAVAASGLSLSYNPTDSLDRPRDLSEMAILVARNPHLIGSIPDSVLYHMYCEIDVRRQVARLMAEDADEGHFFYITCLEAAFTILGGDKLLDNRQRMKLAFEPRTARDKTTTRPQNPFASLDVEPCAEQAPAAAKSTLRGQRAKLKRAPAPAPAQRAALALATSSTPLEVLNALVDKQSLRTREAALKFVRKSVALHDVIQLVWQRVACCQFPSHAAGALLHVATTIIRNNELIDHSDEFLGQMSFLGMVRIATGRRLTDSTEAPDDFEELSGTIGAPTDSGPLVGIYEQLQLHTYWSLVEFARNYRENKTGKPTKRMAAQLRAWDPGMDLETATPEARLSWRRLYTIKLLYQLLDLFSSFSVRDQHSFGLSRLATQVAQLVRQKRDADVPKCIKPSLVFQLQCVVDSWTVRRGWFIDPVSGHRFGKAAEELDCGRVIVKALDHSVSGEPRGPLESLAELSQTLEVTGRGCSNSNILRGRLDGLVGRLGPLLGGPPRPGDATLWNLSPALCGTALMEAVQLLRQAAFRICDTLGTPTALLSLHAHLLDAGFLKEPVPYYVDLAKIFDDRPKLPEEWKLGLRKLVRLDSARDLLDYQYLVLADFARQQGQQPDTGCDEAEADTTPADAYGSYLTSLRRSGWDPDRAVFEFEENSGGPQLDWLHTCVSDLDGGAVIGQLKTASGRVMQDIPPSTPDAGPRSGFDVARVAAHAEELWAGIQAAMSRGDKLVYDYIFRGPGLADCSNLTKRTLLILGLSTMDKNEVDFCLGIIAQEFEKQRGLSLTTPARVFGGGAAGVLG
ncbi:hypothetical protein RB600_003638 [Gaeumannomyces tritici]